MKSRPLGIIKPPKGRLSGQNGNFSCLLLFVVSGKEKEGECVHILFKTASAQWQYTYLSVRGQGQKTRQQLRP